jgi:hypothetical protein
MILASQNTAHKVLRAARRGGYTLLTRHTAPIKLKLIRAEFNPDEPRDNTGKWAKEGGGALKPKQVTSAAIMKKMGWRKIGREENLPHWKKGVNVAQQLILKSSGHVYKHGQYGIITVNHSGGFQHIDNEGHIVTKGSGQNGFQRLGKEAVHLQEYLNRLQNPQAIAVPAQVPERIAAPFSGTRIPDSTDPAVDTALKTVPIISSKSAVGGIWKGKMIVTFADGSKGLFKPQSGAKEEWYNMTPGKDSEREVAAWEVAKLVGMRDMVSPAVIHTVATKDVPGYGGSMAPSLGGFKGHPEGERGALLKWADGKDASAVPDPYDGKDLARAAAFDYVIGNTDRHTNNWVVSEDGKIHLIDHGYAFGEGLGDKHGSNLVGRAKDRRDQFSNPSEYGVVYAKAEPEIVKSLSALGLNSKVIGGVQRRIKTLALSSNWYDL